jgi:hypothetical protein
MENIKDLERITNNEYEKIAGGVPYEIIDIIKNDKEKRDIWVRKKKRTIYYNFSLINEYIKNEVCKKNARLDQHRSV